MAQSSPTSFSADAVPQAPEDPLFGLMAAYRADSFDKKVDLGIGAYRDNDAKPWILPVVKKVSRPPIYIFKSMPTQSSRQKRSSARTPP
jgi:aspartate aminotransferase